MTRFLVGCIAGLAATLPMTAAMVAVHRRLPRRERDPLPPYHITREMSRKVGVDHRLDEEERRALALTAHFAFGAATGGVYGLFDESVPFPPAVRGMTYGLGVWDASYLKGLPALALYRHPAHESPRRKALMIAAHLVWGRYWGCCVTIWPRGKNDIRSDDRREAMALEDREMQAQAAKIESLLEEIESFPDPVLRAKVTEIVQSLLALYGGGLARIVEIVAGQNDRSAGAKTLASFAEDALISNLLLLHDLHPVDVETRVTRALEEVRPYLQSHGGNVELVGVEEGVAYLRLQGHCNGCPSSTMTLKLAIEEAIHKVAPDLLGIEAEGVTEPSPKPAAFIPLSALHILEKK